MFVKSLVVVGVCLQICWTSAQVPFTDLEDVQRARVDLIPLVNLNSKLSQLHTTVDSHLKEARLNISTIYGVKVNDLQFHFEKTINAIETVADSFNTYVNSQPSLFPECVQDAKDLLDAAKVMVGWTMASCHKDVSAAYQSELTHKYSYVESLQRQINGYLTEYLNHLKNKNVFKVTDWDVALVELKNYFDDQEQNFNNGVSVQLPLTLESFEQALTKVNDEYGVCNKKAETRFVDQEESIRNYDLPACNLRVLRTRLKALA